VPISVTSASPDTVNPDVFTVLVGTFPFAEGPAFRVIAVDAMLAETDMGLHTTYDQMTIAVIYSSLAVGVYTFRVEENGNPSNNDSVYPVTVVASGDSVSSVDPVSAGTVSGGEVVITGTLTDEREYFARLEPGGIELSFGLPVFAVDGTLTFLVPSGVEVGFYTIVVWYDDGGPIDLADPLDFEILPPPIPGPPGPGRAPSTFRFVMSGFQPPPAGPYLRGVLAQRAVEYVRQPGSGADEVRTIRAADVAIPALGTVTIDLELSADPYGSRLDLSELVAFYVENVAGGAGGTIEVQPAASDGMMQLLGAGTAVKLRPGTGVVFFVARRDGPGWPVGATTKKLSIVETSGLGAHLVAHVWGRR